jgi:ubiquinone/menaquinone biosynthesis C-methylase UbiE
MGLEKPAPPNLFFSPGLPRASYELWRPSDQSFHKASHFVKALAISFLLLDRHVCRGYIASRKKLMLRKLLGIFFDLLYHPFAWTYDFVAAVVSLGRWRGWVLQAQPFLYGRVLEIGFGPGHLQLALNQAGLQPFGLDESRPMAGQARRRLRRQNYPLRLTNGYAQNLPFRTDSFDCVAATFPSGYIFEAHTLAEIRRVLCPGGRLVIIPSAWITGQSWLERLAAGLFRLTGQAGPLEPMLAAVKQRIAASGFVAIGHELVEAEGSRVLVIVGEK